MLKDMTKEQLLAFKSEVMKQYDNACAKKLKLDMSRGKPCAKQLVMSEGMLTALSTNEDCFTGATDCRNYGGLDGIDEMKEIFASILEVGKENILVGGNSSLNMMYDTVSRAMTFGVHGSDAPWSQQGKIKFLCPVPGYDRHFAICELLGIEMINIPLTGTGPDMDLVEKYVENDPSVKGIWCVPHYSNPTGETYSDEVVDRFASLKPAAKDFRIFWDNAYIIHDVIYGAKRVKNIYEACKAQGNEDRVFMYTSTSKISFPGAGVACLAASEANLAQIKKLLAIQTIGPDKLNQLRHVRFFKNADGILAHMKRHAEILRPKFDIVFDGFEKELTGLGIASWTKPTGGYFISLDVNDGCATRTYDLAKAAGVTLTNVGATFPYCKDPLDKNIRIAPSFPPEDELTQAVEVLCICIKLAAVEKLLAE